MTNFEKVLDFHDKYGVPVGEADTIISADRAMLRSRLMGEEYAELLEAMYLKDRAKIAKELADLLTTTYGTAAEYGIPINQVFDAVHQSNMTKIGADGVDGKIQKGPNYVEPDIDEVLEGMRK